MKPSPKSSTRKETAGVPERHKWDKFTDVSHACDRYMDRNGMKRGFKGFDYGSKEIKNEP